MKDGPDISRLAALIGDPARANMLTALMGGAALTTTELATEAGITLPTASIHLARLEQGGLLRLRQQGRHKYYALADDHVANVLENLMGLAARKGHLRTRPGPRDAALRESRLCYNHLAGRQGIVMFEYLLNQGHLQHINTTLTLTDRGRTFITEFGIDLNALPRSRAPMCRECLDWSERRSHLAGQLGRAMLTHMETLGWIKRIPDSRALRFSRAGSAAFAAHFPPP